MPPSQRLCHVVTSLLGFDIAGGFILFVQVPASILQKWELAGQITDRFQVCICETKDSVRFHQRNGRQYIVGNIASTIDHHIRCDVPQAIDQLTGLHIAIGWVGVGSPPCVDLRRGADYMDISWLLGGWLYS